ncbi:hypothetical protein HPB47_003833, partial [Ixodes persulcatus]
KKKQPVVSFHKIPADVVSREQWLKAISRKDWQPNTTSNYSIVCSNHFEYSCFKTTTKTRRLIQGAVPTKFEGYPSYMKAAPAKQRSTQSVNKRKREPPATVKVQDVQRTLQATTARSQHVDLGLLATPSSDVDDDTSGVLHPEVIYEPAAKRPEHETPDSSQPADEQNQMARQILDKVLNFKKKRPTWSETPLRQCIILRNLLTKSYEYIRQEQLLKLPCRNTLQNYVGNPTGEVGFSSLVYSRLRTEVENLKTPQSSVCSLVVDEMHIRQRLEYHKQRDAFIGDVDTTLSFMKDQAGHTCDVDFASVEPTNEFMKTMHRWFLLMDVSNCKQHIHLNHPDTKQFSSHCDERLDWLEIVFIEYLLELKKNSLPQNVLTKETYHALVLTTHSNVECIRYLLREREFGFVLTRKFSSDPLEALFGCLRRTAGCNGALDMRATLNGLEKMLKTGLIASSSQSNTGTLVTVSSNPAKATISFPLTAEEKLRELCIPPRLQQTGPGAASIAMVGGFIARAISEKINCDSCIALVLKPKSSAPADGLIAYQDGGGLCYHTSERITALTALKSFVDTALQHRKNILKPLQTSVERAVHVMMDLPILTCRRGDRQHRQLFLELLSMKFL